MGAFYRPRGKLGRALTFLLFIHDRTQQPVSTKITVLRCCFRSREISSGQTTNVPAPWSWALQLQNCEHQVPAVCNVTQTPVLCYSSTNGIAHRWPERLSETPRQNQLTLTLHSVFLDTAELWTKNDFSFVICKGWKEGEEEQKEEEGYMPLDVCPQFLYPHTDILPMWPPWHTLSLRH